MLFPPEIINHTTENHFAKNSTKSKVIYLTLVITIIMALISLPLIHVEVSTQVRGIIRAPYDNSQLQSAVYGEVEHIFISENMYVNRGDTLICLKDDKIKEQININQQKITENNKFIKDIQFLNKNQNDSISTSKYLTEYNYFQSKMFEEQTNIEYLHKEYELHKSLFEKKITPKQEYLQYKNRYESARNRKKNTKKQFLNKWQYEKTKLELENISLISNIKQFQEEQTKYIIRAPYSGSIIQFTGIQKGSFIGLGQTIAYISTDKNLIVECFVSPSDIGYIKAGQKSIFQMDAYHYNQWGLAYGSVKEISNDIISIENQPVFRVRCSLDKKYLELKNGYKGNLKKGMTLTGRFFLTKRTLWQLLFDKVDNWVNPKIIKEI